MPVSYSRTPFADTSLGFTYAPPAVLARYCLSRGGYVCTPNALMLEHARSTPSFLHVLESASVLTPDGVGALTLLRMNGVRAFRSTGVSLGLAVAAECARTHRSLFLYGARPHRAEVAALCLCRRFPTLKIAGILDGYTVSEDAAAAAIRASGASAVFVCLGSPRQEIFMHRYADSGRCFFGLGGSLDVYAGAARRAPRVVGDCGFEWLFRILQEPTRAKKLPDLAKFYLHCGTDLVKKLNFHPKNEQIHRKIRQI